MSTKRVYLSARLALWLLGITGALLSHVTIGRGDEPPKLDLYGDPLPAGAVARLGTMRLRFEGPVFLATFSSDGKYLATGEHNGWISFWETRTGRLLWRLDTGDINTTLAAIQISQDGAWVITVDFEGKVSFWNAKTGTIGRRVFLGSMALHKAQFRAVENLGRVEPLFLYKYLAVSPNGKYVAGISDDGVIDGWRINESDAKLELRESAKGKHPRIAFSPSELQLAWTDETESAIQLKSLDRKSDAPRLLKHPGLITALAFSPSGETLAAAYSDRSVLLWTWRTDEIQWRHRFKDNDKLIRSLHFDIGGKEIYTTTTWLDREPPIWTRLDATSGAVLGELEPKLPDTASSVVAISPDGKFYLVNDQKASEEDIVNVSNGTCVPHGPSHTDWIRSISFSRDGRFVVTTSKDETIRLWETATSKPICRIPSCTRSRFFHPRTI